MDGSIICWFKKVRIRYPLVHKGLELLSTDSIRFWNFYFRNWLKVFFTCVLFFPPVSSDDGILKGKVSRDCVPTFFTIFNPSGLVIHKLKYFCIWCQFRGDILICKKTLRCHWHRRVELNSVCGGGGKNLMTLSLWQIYWGGQRANEPVRCYWPNHDEINK